MNITNDKKIKSEETDGRDYKALYYETLDQLQQTAEELEDLQSARDKRYDVEDELRQRIWDRTISVKGTANLNDVVRVLVLSGYEVLVTADSEQQQKPSPEDVWFSISFLHREFENITFSPVEI